MGVWNRKYPCADLIYCEEDKFGASKLIKCDTKGKLSFFLVGKRGLKFFYWIIINFATVNKEVGG